MGGGGREANGFEFGFWRRRERGESDSLSSAGPSSGPPTLPFPKTFYQPGVIYRGKTRPRRHNLRTGFPRLNPPAPSRHGPQFATRRRGCSQLILKSNTHTHFSHRRDSAAVSYATFK